MANPPKQKGTGFEREVMSALADKGLEAYRGAPGAQWDITVGGSTGRHIEALATRPDFGRALVTMSLADFIHLLASHGDGALIECKRYKRFAHHSIFDDTFPR